MNRKLLVLMFAIAGLQLGSCATTTNSSVSGVERKQFLMLPESQVESMSIQAYTQTLQEASKNKKLNTDSAELQRVRNISNRLIAHTKVFRADALSWKWEVNVEESDQVNAYCMPGGKIMVFTGLIDKLKATDDELAAVIGHEIAHALREHGRERMSIAAVQQVGVAGLAVLAAGSKSSTAGAGVQAAAMGSQLFFALPNGREQEREADRMGLELAARAGFNPNAAVTLWQKMGALNSSAPPEFLSTHPSSTNRIADLQKLIPSVMPLYQQARK
ncbi:M48 family metallopeptidase [Methylobacillus flagellatus]|uniref:M48 family metallopeptidase n=1 Tax=Methylobacillus flagellatus TaxID=405 RepID=UPI0010F4FF9E|nr:M48 family metallopeptidase [Methylobacillus flagellatus]